MDQDFFQEWQVDKNERLEEKDLLQFLLLVTFFIWPNIGGVTKVCVCGCFKLIKIKTKIKLTSLFFKV